METAERKTSRDDAVDRLHQQLQDSLHELVTSQDWQRALAVAARFHDYSFANTRLIWGQSIARGFTPRRVAGYRAWQELSRHVRKGERGLQILAPVIGIAQTDGDPLPEVPITLLEGDLPTAPFPQSVTRVLSECQQPFQEPSNSTFTGSRAWLHVPPITSAASQSSTSTAQDWRRNNIEITLC